MTPPPGDTRGVMPPPQIFEALYCTGEKHDQERRLSIAYVPNLAVSKYLAIECTAVCLGGEGGGHDPLPLRSMTNVPQIFEATYGTGDI